MRQLKIHILNRDYSEYELYDAITLNRDEIVLPLCPSEAKLFSNDLIKIEDDTVALIHSATRSGGSFPGILVLDQNKTYGRQKNKLLFKCIPDDKRIPLFLIPYEMKTGFSKKQINKYVTFQFHNWDSKHPHGRLTNVIGDVDQLNKFYEYQLFCKSLNDSIQNFTRDTKHSLKNKSETFFIKQVQEMYPSVEDRRENDIISIDPPQSRDFDDALGIIDMGNDEYILSIYIANVPLWLEILDLWKSFSKRVSTIYLPDRKRPMLPTILSDNLCSLQENKDRLAFSIDIHIQNKTIKDIHFANSIISVKHNYRYEDQELEDDELYKTIFKATNSILEKHKYLDTIKNSHDVVTYTMILMNHICAQKLIEYKDGIYRTLEANETVEIPENLPKDIKKHIHIWHCSGGQYKTFSNKTRHDFVSSGLNDYIHITSPIRRLVDLLNIYKIQEYLDLIQYSSNAERFYKTWIDDIDYINVTMRAIRRVQSDCALLNLCFTNEEIVEKEFIGYIFDKLERNDGLFQYMVYIPELKINNRFIYQNDLENYESRVFKIYIFTDENSLKRKIRLQINLK
jgi:exoribonuclease R